eukprot:4729502-Amphidinium_carterae.1
MMRRIAIAVKIVFPLSSVPAPCSAISTRSICPLRIQCPGRSRMSSLFNDSSSTLFDLPFSTNLCVGEDFMFCSRDLVQVLEIEIGHDGLDMEDELVRHPIRKSFIL